jgi:hypothetical protein
MDELIRNLIELQTLEFSEAQADNAAALIVELRSKIPPQILDHYDRLRVRGKKGLAAVSNQVCTGCHMRQPLAVIMTLKHRQDMQLCDSCGRYLYLAAEAENAPQKQAESAKPVRTPRRRKSIVAVAPGTIKGLTPAAQANRINPE